jgi:hypothetical protein
VSTIKSKDEFDALMHEFLGTDSRKMQRVSSTMSDYVKKVPTILVAWDDILVEKLLSPQTKAGWTRNILRFYQFAEIPERIEGELYQLCFEYITNPVNAIAIRAFSMTICTRIAQRYPELKAELYDAISMSLPNGSAGLKNRGEKMLKKL